MTRAAMAAETEREERGGVIVIKKISSLNPGNKQNDSEERESINIVCVVKL